MGYQHGLKIGLKQSVVQLGTKAPIYLAKKWWGAWWVHGPTGVTLNTKLIADFAAYNAATILAEIVSRQFYEDPHRRFFTPDGINKVSVYNLLQKIPVSVIAGPIIKLNNFWARYAVWRTLDSVSSSLASATVDGGEVNWKLVKFEQNYGGSIGAATGEVERVMQMAIYNSAIPAKISFFIGTTLKLAFLFPKSALKAYSLEIYLGHDTVSADDLIKRFRDDMGINLKNFSEEDILEGIEQFRADSEVKEFMNLRPVDAIASEQAK